MKAGALHAAVLSCVVCSAAAQNPYFTVPEWRSSEPQCSTGAAAVDLDRDGWLDLIVADGNEIAQQHLVVYYNQGGTLPTVPDRKSSDRAYNGHVAIADVNGDGWLDVAVARCGTGTYQGTAARVYLNNQGTLSSTPDWEASETANAYTVAFGDMNNDGRPDLAIGTGWPYTPQRFAPAYVYLNTGSTLASAPSWISDDTDHQQYLLWIDADHDGWLDLLSVSSRSPVSLYRNVGGTLETTASWNVNDGEQDGVQGTYGDVNDDGLPDLIIADNQELGGTGCFKQYPGVSPGVFSSSAIWEFYGNEVSAVTLADVNADGNLDLATGIWSDKVMLFTNTGDGLSASPVWQSTWHGTTQRVVLADINNDGLRYPLETFQADAAPGKRLFILKHQPVEDVLFVTIDGQPLTPDQYVVGHEHGWLAVGVDAQRTVSVRYRYSLRPDLAVTNSHPTGENCLFFNHNTAGRLGDFDLSEKVDAADFVVFTECQSGPDKEPMTGCEAGDADLDTDVDLADFALFSWVASPAIPR